MPKGGVYTLTPEELEAAMNGTERVSPVKVDVDLPTLAVDPKEAARILGVSVTRVNNWRRSGLGPKFFHIDPNKNLSCVLYPVSGLREWVDEAVRAQLGAEVDRDAAREELKAARRDARREGIPVSRARKARRALSTASDESED